MTDVLFRFDVEAAPETVLEAVKTTEGVKGFWTSRADVPGEVGETLELEFAMAPLPFDLRLEQSDDRTVVWRTETFPPHWVGTTVRWDVAAQDGGSTVSFRHAGLSDDEETGRVSYTWGQIMVQLKQYAETGSPTRCSSSARQRFESARWLSDPSYRLARNSDRWEPECLLSF